MIENHIRVAYVVTNRWLAALGQVNVSAGRDMEGAGQKQG